MGYMVKNKEERNHSKVILIRIIIGTGVAIILILLAAVSINSESFKRIQKTTESDVNGGLERIVEVYSDNGELVKSYEGKFDVTFDDDGSLVFDDKNDKRHIIKGGVIIIDEK